MKLVGKKIMKSEVHIKKAHVGNLLTTSGVNGVDQASVYVDANHNIAEHRHGATLKKAEHLKAKY